MATGPSKRRPSPRCRRPPRANTPVANRNSHGTSLLNACEGVTSNRIAPIVPPTRLMIERLRSSLFPSCGVFLTTSREAQAVTNCPGASATVLEALASMAGMPAAISDGKVRNAPPPASALTIPDANAAKASRISMGPRSAGRDAARSDDFAQASFPLEEIRADIGLFLDRVVVAVNAVGDQRVA